MAVQVVYGRVRVNQTEAQMQCMYFELNSEMLLHADLTGADEACVPAAVLRRPPRPSVCLFVSSSIACCMELACRLLYSAC